MNWRAQTMRIKDLKQNDTVRYFGATGSYLATVQKVVTDMTNYRDVAYVIKSDGMQGTLTDNDKWLFYDYKVSNKKQYSSDVQQKKRFEHLEGVLDGKKVTNKRPDDTQRGKVELIDSETVEFENGRRMKVIINNGKTKPTSVYWVDDKTIGFDNGSRVRIPENYETKQTNDIVNKPSHYTYGKIEIIEIVEQVTETYPTHIAFSIGNALKYICRAPFKNGVEDLKKAVWYLNRCIEKWEEK